MDKVWFALRQTHYTAPDPSTLGTATEDAPISLGHLIPSLRKLDHVINRGSIEPFLAGMRCWHSHTIDFSWGKQQTAVAESSVTALAPTPAGISVGGNIAVAFQKSVANAWEFEQLDTYIFQPTESYVNKVLTQATVKTWIDKHKTMGTWSIYMITGIMIAKAATFQKSESGKSSIAGGPQVSLPTIAEAEFQGKLGRTAGLDTSGKLTTDFVWAIRLARISRNLVDIVLQNDWSVKTTTKGATHSVSSELEVEDIKEILDEESLQAEVLEDEKLGLAFVF